MFNNRQGAIRAIFYAIAAVLLLVTVQAVSAHGFQVGDIKIGHPWSRETPAGAKVAAGYLKITNNGAQADRLIAVSGEIAGKAEIHEMSVDAQGVMTMRGVDAIEIPAGGEVELKPGSFHIMFMDLSAHAKVGERFAGSLTFEKAGKVDVEFVVEPLGGGAKKAPEGDHQGHGGHGG